MPVDIIALPADYAGSQRLTCSSPQHNDWIPVASTSASSSLDSFWRVCEGMVMHPERNSTSILRCDIIPIPDDDAHGELSFRGFQLKRRIRRKILPRRLFDGELEQDCYFFQSQSGDLHTEDEEGLVVLLPLLAERTEAAIPYYHPKVAGVAFRYLGSDNKMQLDILPLEAPSIRSVIDGEPYYAPEHRIYRTAMALLTTLHKHGKGMQPETAYKKRVVHDIIVKREDFQDLYLRLKEKYTWIVDAWMESTDPMKHVFEDVAILTFLICLWRDMYRATGGKPPGGFVDVGCGNGLLVFLLMKEGYHGYGVDLRARKSWALWEGADLRVTALSPPELCLAPSSTSPSSTPFPPASFLIGNHADELTPWLPLIAALTPEAGFINIPCCCHRFSDRFTAATHTFPPELLGLPGVQDDWNQYESLASEKGGRYNAYLTYIAEQTVTSGWRLEREALRIPSTKCWAFVGRGRIYDRDSDEEEQIREGIRVIAEQHAPRWRPRKPEGKDH